MSRPVGRSTAGGRSMPPTSARGAPPPHAAAAAPPTMRGQPPPQTRPPPAAVQGQRPPSNMPTPQQFLQQMKNPATHAPPPPAAAPVPARPAPAPAPASDDDDEDEYDYEDDFVDDFDDFDEPPKPTAAPVGAKPPSGATSTGALPTASDIQRMIASENKQIVSPSNANRSIGPTSPAIAAANGGTGPFPAPQPQNTLPSRKFVPLAQSKAAALSGAYSGAEGRQGRHRVELERVRGILAQIELSVEKFDHLFNMEPMDPVAFNQRQSLRGLIRDVGTQYSEDWVSTDAGQTDAVTCFELGNQAPDDYGSVIVQSRKIRTQATQMRAVGVGGAGVGVGVGTDTRELESMRDAEESEAAAAATQASLAGISQQRFQHFVTNAAGLIERLLAESGAATGLLGSGVASPSAAGPLAALSAGGLTLTPPKAFGTERRIKAIQFCKERHNMLVVAYGKVPEEVIKRETEALQQQQQESQQSQTNEVDGISDPNSRKPFFGLGSKCLILVWDMSSLVSSAHAQQRPKFVCYAEGEPTCITMDAASRPVTGGGGGAGGGGNTTNFGVIVAGMEEGSLALFDLREDTSLHRTVQVPNTSASTATATTSTSMRSHSYTLRHASFITDALRSENHEAPVKCVVALSEAIAEGANAPAFKQDTNNHVNDVAQNGGVASDSNDTPEGEFDLLSLSSGGASGSGGSSGGLLSSTSSPLQFASLDLFGFVHIWTGIELHSVDPTRGNEIDLGLAPGSRLKLTRSLALPYRAAMAHCLAFQPGSSTDFLIGVGSGGGGVGAAGSGKLNDGAAAAATLASVRRGARLGRRPEPFEYGGGDEEQDGEECTAIAFHPHHSSYFLAGYSSGSICLFSLDCSTPLSRWIRPFHATSASSTATSGGSGDDDPSTHSSVVSLHWSSFRPSLFTALDGMGRLLVFDLIHNTYKPVATALLQSSSNQLPSSSESPLVSMVLSSAPPRILPGEQCLLAFPTVDGENNDEEGLQIHVLKPPFSSCTDDEREKFANFLQHVHA